MHVELGIAITLNKNILRVSGRNLIEVGSDIRGYEVNKYSNEADLSRRIEEYLNLFLSIKELPLTEAADEFYKLYFLKEEIIHRSDTFRIIPAFKMRDGAVKVKFKFKEVVGEDGWFGVHFRYGTHPWMGGYLLYIRQNGKLEMAEMPRVNILRLKKYTRLKIDEEHLLQFGVDGDDFVACLDGRTKNLLRIRRGLNNQSPGLVGISCYECTVSFKEVETVIRDTINFD